MDITLSVNLPPDVEERLRAESGDLSSAVRESFAINLFRRGILTTMNSARYSASTASKPTTC